MLIKIKKDGFFLILLALIIISFLIRFWDIQIPGYNVDETLIISGGIKYYLPSAYNPSLYDNALPGAKIFIGFLPRFFSGRDFSEIASYGIRLFAITTVNSELLKGMEFYSRIPSALMGFIAGIFVFLLIKEIYGRNAGIVAFILFSFNTLLITYSRLALGEIFQISYMIISIYFLYKSFFSKKPYFLILSGIFLGLCFGTKLNGLMVLPFFILIIILKNIKLKKKSLNINYKNILIKSSIIFGISFFVLWAIVGFDLGTIIKISEYYGEQGYTGFGFYHFDILKEMFFYVNPLFWPMLAYSIYLMVKNRDYYNFKDQFMIVLLLISFVSPFFKTQATIKRGIQFSVFMLLFSAKIFEDVKNKKIYFLPLAIFLIDFGLIMYFFPNTALATSITCLSQKCIEDNALFYYDGRAVGEKLNDLPKGLIYDVNNLEGYAKFYLNEPDYYLNSGLLSWIYKINNPSFELLKYNNFSYVSTTPFNEEGLMTLSMENRDCKYYPVFLKGIEISRIYDLNTC